MGSIESVALIGSFKQHYQEVEEVSQAFGQAGLTVTSPRGVCIVEEGMPFVRFECDPAEWSDEMVQTVALHRILRADFVYVVAPHGYIGRATCYEIGRVIQARRPIHFSHPPTDLPLLIPSANISTCEEIVAKIASGGFTPLQIHATVYGEIGELEQKLVDERYSEI
ncbi:MAG: hypothetical protein KQI62_17025 [Deltaproteobacteria bacterium]|nr:hypothetical protein [Deltaproteobacteria bacterium]